MVKKVVRRLHYSEQYCYGCAPSSARKWAALRGTFSPWTLSGSCGMKPRERLKKLHHVTCIVVRSKGYSDPFAARRT
jgi:hypothetical protein